MPAKGATKNKTKNSFEMNQGHTSTGIDSSIIKPKKKQGRGVSLATEKRYFFCF